MAHDLHAPSETYEPSTQPRTPRVSRDERQGWTYFAATLFLVGAGLNGMYGIAALVNDDYFAVDELLFGDLTAWGLGYLVVAGVQVVTAVLLLADHRFGVWLGVLLALTHALLALLTIGAYPIWSLCAIAIDGFVLYALTVHRAAGSR